jgi:Flp pilus assembly protein TadD
MLIVDPTLNHIPARREHVVSLYESINQPLVNIPNHGTAPTGAFLLGTRNEHGFYTVFVYLHQPETRAVIIYVSEPRNLNAEQFRLEETEAVRFVESMGFMVDSVHFRQLGPVEQDAVIARVPIFRPPVATLDLYEVHEEVGQQAADPIFGGMGAVGDEIFRRAGLGMPQGPMPGQGMQGHGTGPIGQNVRFSGPGSGSLPGMPNFGPPTPSQRGMNFSMPPQMPQPMQPMPSLPPQPAQPVQPAPLAQPAQPQASPAQNAEALERLGRLLAAFSFLFALSFAAAPACKSGGASETLTTTEQNQIDMGEQHLAGRQWAEAISAFAEVLKGEPNEKTALRGTGLAYLSLGRKDEAEPYYRRAIEADPKWSEPKNELAGILISTGRCDEAEKLLLAVTQDIFYPTPEFAEHNLALALSCQGRQEEAVAKLETLLVKRPQFCLGYLTLSQLSAQTRQHETTVKACEDFDRFCAKHEKIREQVKPEHSAVCYLRSGMAHAQMGDVESARTSFMRCQTDSSAVAKECQRALEMLPE